MEEKYDVFISYSHSDVDAITEIKNALSKNGLSYWHDDECIYGGDNYIEEIAAGIRASRVFVFVSSKHSNKSTEWIGKEIATATHFGKPIIPFRLDDSPYSDSIILHLAALNHINGCPRYVAYSKLIKAIKQHITSPFPPEPPKPPKPFRFSIKEAILKNWKRYCFIFVTILLLFGIFKTLFPDTTCKPVNLELDSGTLWADRNLGADSPTDFGDLFAWGSSHAIEAQDDFEVYAKKTPKFLDAASNNSKELKIPSKEQFQELIDCCDWELDTVNKGFRIVSKRNKSKSIFLPAAGYLERKDRKFKYEKGFYWTSDEDSIDKSKAYELFFGSQRPDTLPLVKKQFGRSIRPVYSSSK